MLLEEIDEEVLSEAVKTCDERQRLEERGEIDALRARYPGLRRYFPAFFALPFQAEPGNAAILSGLDVVRHLERLKLSTPYPVIVEHIASLLREPELDGQMDLVVDRTGVGAPVCGILDQAGLEFAGITISGGDNVSEENGHYRVPKRDLVSVIQVLQQTHRLKIVPDLPEAQTLMQEMQAFRVKINPETMHDSYNSWREGTHDDLLLALAIACWYGENRPEPWYFW